MLDDIIYDEIATEGTGQILEDSVNEMKYQLTFLESPLPTTNWSPNLLFYKHYFIPPSEKPCKPIVSLFHCQ